MRCLNAYYISSIPTLTVFMLMDYNFQDANALVKDKLHRISSKIELSSEKELRKPKNS